MPEKNATKIEIRLKNLSYAEGHSLLDFIEKQEGVKRVRVRSAGMVSFESRRARNPVEFKAFEVAVGTLIGKKGLDIAFDWIREWLKKEKPQHPDSEIIIYGPDDKPLKKVKRKRKTKRGLA